MIGNNELILNNASMLQAVQLWLNDQFKVPPTVVSVEQTKTGSYSKEFTVHVTDTAAPIEVGK